MIVWNSCNVLDFKHIISFIGNDALAFNPIIIKHIHFAFIKVSVYHIFLLICQ